MDPDFNILCSLFWGLYKGGGLCRSLAPTGSGKGSLAHEAYNVNRQQPKREARELPNN